MTDFQNVVNATPSPAIEGDFASNNPYFSMDAGPGGLVAGTAGVTLGRFAWANAAQVVSNAYPSGANPVARLGFAQREGNMLAFITAWMGSASMLVPVGNPITLMTSADVWARLNGTSGAIGQKAFAKYADGSIIAGAAGSTPGGTVTANTTSGSANLVALSGALVAGQPVSGAGIPAGATIITGAAAGGTAVMSANATATASGVTVTAVSAVETPWFLTTAGNNGELVKLSRLG